jgi:tripartite-type tricarboxylate transporter receptor subunit TctC
MMLDAVTTMMPNVEAGQLRALGVSGEKRSENAPNIPTMSEAGVPGYEATIWLGLVAPKGTPKPVVDKLNAEISKIIDKPEIKQAWAKQGAVAMKMNPAEFEAYMAKDIEKWAEVIKKANISTQ